MSKKAKEHIMEVTLGPAHPMLEVTLWSKQPTRDYMPVKVEICALIDHGMTFVILTRPDGMAMGMNLTVEGTEKLGKDLLMIHKRFQASEKDKEWLHQ